MCVRSCDSESLCVYVSVRVCVRACMCVLDCL